MTWWKKLFGANSNPRRSPLQRVRLHLPGWNEESTEDDSRVWRNEDRDMILLTRMGWPKSLVRIADEAALREDFRAFAQGRGAGLIEARSFTGPFDLTASIVYKTLQIPAYVFTGMLLAPAAVPPMIWTVRSQEQGTTGVREAIITAEMFEAGIMTPDEYVKAWAQDPYDPRFDGVDRKVLRFFSDDERFDERFPNHPLSKVRRILASLPESVEIGPA